MQHCGSICLEIASKKCALKYFVKFTGKQLCQSLFFNKVAGLRPVTLFKKRSWHRCFPVNFEKFLRTFFYRTPGGSFLQHRFERVNSMQGVHPVRLLGTVIVFKIIKCLINVWYLLYWKWHHEKVEIFSFIPFMAYINQKYRPCS